jgi:hypothetical protein
MATRRASVRYQIVSFCDRFVAPAHALPSLLPQKGSRGLDPALEWHDYRFAASRFRRKRAAVRTGGWRMLTEQDRVLVLSVWAALVSVAAIYFLTGSFWKAALIGAFVGGSSLLGYGTRWVLKGSFAIAVLAIAVALGLPPPDQWPQLIHQVQEAVLAFRAGG